MRSPIKKSAIISACGKFRYELRRVWDDELPPYVSGMLNPSTADDVVDDRTIVRNLRRAASLGFGSLIVWNLGAGRSAHPKVWKSMADPIGPENDAHILRVLTECRERNGIAVVGWGNDGIFRQRDLEVFKLAQSVGVILHCLGVTKSGQPRHPLYVADAQHLISWPGSEG